MLYSCNYTIPLFDPTPQHKNYNLATNSRILSKPWGNFPQAKGIIIWNPYISVFCFSFLGVLISDINFLKLRVNNFSQVVILKGKAAS